MRGLIALGIAIACVTQPALAAQAPAQQAAPNAESLALGQRIAAALWPDGSYGRMLNEIMGGEDGIVDMVLNMTAADVVGEDTLKKGSKDGKVPEAAKKSLRETMRAKDPHFEERMRLTMKAVGEEMTRAFAPLEPKMRSGLAQALARRFTREQLSDIAVFFSTPSGKAYGEQSLTIFTDKALMTEMMSAVPEMVKQMPQVMERVKKATAHLPPPPKPAEPEVEEGEAEESADDLS